MGGGDAGGDAGDSGSGSSQPSAAVESTAAATPAAGGGGSLPVRAPAAPAYTGPPPGPPIKQRVPMWAMPVLVALPLWALLYSGAFGERTVAAAGPVAQGQTVYRSAGCGSCHGATGGGGIGPALAGVTKTFPKFEDHVAWVESGSKPLTGQPYGATGKIATGGMPAFKESLSPADIIAVVCHERVDYGKETPIPAQCQEGASPAGGAGGANAGATTTTAGH
jgi:mono/diheme cytochrome c family protein